MIFLSRPLSVNTDTVQYYTKTFYCTFSTGKFVVHSVRLILRIGEYSLVALQYLRMFLSYNGASDLAAHLCVVLAKC